MKNKLLRLASCSFLLTASSVYSQLDTFTNFTTGTFNTNQGWIRNDALAYDTNGAAETGQNYDAPVGDQWYTDDPYNAGLSNGATSILKHFDGWTLGQANGGNNSVLFGGYGLADDILPGTADPSMYRAFDLLPLTETVTFTSDFALIPSSGSYPNKDRFGFSLLDSTGTVSLAEFVFNPVSGSTASLIGVEWVANGLTNVIADIQYSFLYRMSATLEGNSFDLTLSALQTQTNASGVVTNYVVTNSFLLVSGGALSGGLSATDFGTVGIDWELSSGNANDAGNNYMLINNVSVLSTAIPEPGTWAAAALLLSGVAASVIRRRRTAVHS